MNQAESVVGDCGVSGNYTTCYDPCMNGNGKQPVRPHGTGFYFGVAAFASLAGSVFTWGVFVANATSFPWRLVRTGVAIIFLLGAMQSFERLFRPEKAQSRSSSLSSLVRRRLRTVCKSIVAVCITAVAIAALLRLAGGQYERDLATDLQVLSAVLFLQTLASPIFVANDSPGCFATVDCEPRYGIEHR